MYNKKVWFSGSFRENQTFLWGGSCHFQGQGLAAQDVEVQVGHGLARVGAAVAHHPVAARQALRPGDGGDDLKNVGHQSAVFGGDAVAAGDMDLGDHQNVGGRLGRDVPEGEDGVVLVYLGGGDLPGDDPAEQTIRHFHYLLKEKARPGGRMNGANPRVGAGGLQI